MILLLAALVFPPRMEIFLGGIVSLGPTAPTSVEPMARLTVDWTIAGEKHPLKAHITGELTALPDQLLDLTDAATFNAVELALAMSYRPSVKVSAAGYCEAGFASRMHDGLVQSATSAPLWGACGLRFEDGRNRLTVGLGRDERLGSRWTWAATVSGAARVVGMGPVDVVLTVSAVLGLERDPASGQRNNVVRVGTAFGLGR